MSTPFKAAVTIAKLIVKTKKAAHGASGPTGRSKNETSNEPQKRRADMVFWQAHQR